MRFNSLAREIVCKVVYYGPGLAGKTSNMQWVRDHVPAQQASELVSVDTHSERTLHFDWLALDLGQVQDVNVRFEFFTVPGQNYYAATRRQVLQAADGVVFVADSRREALDENIDSMNEMLNNLRHHGLPDDLPVVMQYNKQDLPTALRREQLEPLMNVRGWPSFASTAISGEGVMETSRAIGQLVAERMARQEIPQLQAQAAPAPASQVAQSWLISCWRCQTILEVPTADIGSTYTCGVCGSTLEVVDSERGLTRAPAQAHDDSGGYQMHGAVVGDAQAGAAGVQTSALGTRSVPAERTVAVSDAKAIGAGQGGFEIDGYEFISALDESVQGGRSRVRERATGRNLRVLILAAQLVRQPGYRDNLEPYVRMAGPIKHPNVLPLTNLRPLADSAALFSADPPDHEPLAHVLARRRALAPPHAMGLLRQISLALEEAARHGVVHGWLRPDVVLVSPDGGVLIDELCVPKNHRFLVRELAGASAATEYYLAPEHLGDDSRSDLRSDIFVLGSLLFRMITGEGLVTGYSAHEALHKVVANGPRPLRSTQAGVSRDLDLFYQRLVAAERRDRFQSYREVIDALDKFGGGAKRQTLKLTGTAAISPAAAARGVRSSANAHIARRANTGGSGNYPGRQRQPGQPQTGSVRKRSDPTASIVVVLLLVVLGVIAVAVLYSQSQHGSQAISDTTPRPGPSAPPAPAHTTYQPDATPNVASGSAPAAGTAPGSGPAVVVPVQTPLQRAELLDQIANLRTDGHYQDALDATRQLDSANERDNLRESITTEHEHERQEIQANIAQSTDLSYIKRRLQPAQTLWGMTGDAEWANAQLAKAESRLANGAVEPAPQTPADTTAATPAQPDGPRSPLTGQPIRNPDQPAQPADPAAPVVPSDSQPLPVLPPVADPAATVSATVDQALLKDVPNAALQALGDLDAASLETKALRLEINWWGKRAELVAKAAQAQKVKLRIPNPTTGEIWDVVGADHDNLDVSSPSGSRTSLSWQQFQIKDIAHMIQAAASPADSSGEDNAIAAVMCLLADDVTQASLQLKLHRAAMDNDTAAEIEALIGLHRRRDMLQVLTRANAALKSGNVHALSDCIDELQRSDRSVQASLAPQIQQLEDALKTLRQHGAASPGAAAGSPARDKLSFDSMDDLEAFPDKGAHWRVQNSMATNLESPAHLSRSDLSNGKSASVRFQAESAHGVMAINFRGALVSFDLGASTYTVGKDKHARGMVIIPKVAYTILLERRDDSHTRLTLSNGDTVDIDTPDLSETLTISLDGGATVDFDEIDLFRDAAGPSMAEKQKALAAVGWDPIANAYLDAPTIVLPASPGVPSGIATPLRDNIKSYTLDAKGTGKLKFRLTRHDPGRDETFVELAVDLPKNPQEFMTIQVRWTEQGLPGCTTPRAGSSGSRP